MKLPCSREEYVILERTSHKISHQGGLKYVGTVEVYVELDLYTDGSKTLEGWNLYFW